MSKGFIYDILDNLISKSAKEVENKIFDEIENNFNDDIVFSENHKDKINNILYRNKTKNRFSHTYCCSHSFCNYTFSHNLY